MLGMRAWRLWTHVGRLYFLAEELDSWYERSHCAPQSLVVGCGASDHHQALKRRPVHKASASGGGVKLTRAMCAVRPQKLWTPVSKRFRSEGSTGPHTFGQHRTVTISGVHLWMSYESHDIGDFPGHPGCSQQCFPWLAALQRTCKGGRSFSFPSSAFHSARSLQCQRGLHMVPCLVRGPASMFRALLRLS